VVVFLLLMVEVGFVVFGSLVAVVGALMMRVMGPGKRWACKHSHEQNCCKQFLHAKNPITRAAKGSAALQVRALKEQPGECRGPKWPGGAGLCVMRVVVMVVVVMVVCRKCGRTGEHHQEQNYAENLLHGWHPSRIEFLTKATCLNSYQKNNEGRDQKARRRRPGILGNSTQEA
jgi:hypothetical protein